MELLNFVSWLKKGLISKTVAPKDLIPLGVRLSDREDSYVTTVITGEDLINSITASVGNVVGPVGAQGPQGPQGVAGPVGPAGLNWQGAWVSGASYVIDDAVGYGGASWFCITATSGTTTPNLDPTNWALLASQGSPGQMGPQGIQGPSGSASYAFTQVNNTPQYSYPSASPYVADFITIPANTFNATTKAVLGLTASVNKIGTNGLFKIQAYITTTLPVLNTTLITGTRLGGAVTTTIAQRGQKIERDLAINGNSIYYINITDTNDSNSDGAILAASANYNGLLFDTVFSSVPINWTSTVYISLIIVAASPLDLFGARYITVSKK